MGLTAINSLKGILFCCFLSFYGCSVPVNFYLVNSSEKELRLKVVFNDETTSTKQLAYAKNVEALSFNLYQEFGDLLDAVDEKDGFVVFKLPANATVYLGQGINFNNFTLKEVRIASDSDEIALNWKNRDQVNVEKSFINRYYAWYEAK